METFRVRHASPDQQRKILLPISLGVSSVCLLHILNHHLNTQKTKTGRTGFTLHVLYVDKSNLENTAAHPESLNKVRERYPDHEYSAVPLEDVFRSDLEDSFLSDILHQDTSNQDVSPSERLATLMNSLTSATARADVISTLTIRLIVAHAKSIGCEGVLWGDSTTRLGERTLSETAKGRGFSLPWQIADGESPFGITFNYPLRDVLKKELVAYSKIIEPPLEDLILNPSASASQAPVSSKNTTIDDLMKQYFESVEENFPSIVSNVVRTSGKLEIPAGAVSEPRCGLCNNPVPSGRFGVHGWGGDQEDSLAGSANDIGHRLCYGCTRSIPNTRWK